MSHWECEKNQAYLLACFWLGIINICVLATQVLSWDKCCQQDVSSIFSWDTPIPLQETLKTVPVSSLDAMICECLLDMWDFMAFSLMVSLQNRTFYVAGSLCIYKNTFNQHHNLCICKNTFHHHHNRIGVVHFGGPVCPHRFIHWRPNPQYVCFKRCLMII